MPSAISMTSPLVLRCGSSRLDCARRYAIHLNRWNADALIGTPRTATALSSSTFAIVTPRRTYYWPYPDNFVPEKATTSSFQSSPVPSVRERIMREYALSPLFGSRTPCCVLGFAGPAAALVEVKRELRCWIAQALGKVEGEVELGPLQQAKEMMLHRSGTDESPRLADGPWSRPDAEQRRLSRYARLPVQARTLVEVYLPKEEEEVGSTDCSGSLEEDADGASGDGAVVVEDVLLVHGWFLQEQLYKYISFREKESKQQQGGHYVAEGARSAVESGVAVLHDKFGVVYCEVPALDESGFFFDQLHGKGVDADTAERVVDRWTRRVAQQRQREQEQKRPSS
ncbi:hypothetical protein ABL78_3971 [Leptomonas seymouri]|uniref:Uncharacterized protein n=1 Tax=Leptomonas seymouri TaxID=5684 RepID=A0A0N1PCF7_LEPSE|nr:hypothetical protein ABL78_3971 [Leptomonas seymouri]|eukprot:KPI86980.1 hypothetical protein ABL78_3971 [Leptomonas seymouri]